MKRQNSAHKQLPVPMSGGLILSYRCNAACRHCMYACSPRWNSDWISEKDLEQVLGQLAGKIVPSPLGPEAVSLNHGLHLTGGEPFLNYELLCRAVEMCSRMKIPSVFVETNCFWCTSDEVASRKMNKLKQKGLKGILISVNPFYLEYVPFEKTRRAVRAAGEIFGRNLMVYQQEYFRRFEGWGIRERVGFGNYLEMENMKEFTRNVEFFVMGRAPYQMKGGLEECYPRYPAAHFFGVPCMPPFLRGWHNHFDSYGNYLPGYCGGVSLGDCRRIDSLLEEGVDTREHPVLGYLMDEDLEGLYEFASDYGYREPEQGYFSSCHLCTDLRRHLAAEGEFSELSPLEFYSHLEE